MIKFYLLNFVLAWTGNAMTNINDLQFFRVVKLLMQSSKIQITLVLIWIKVKTKNSFFLHKSCLQIWILEKPLILVHTSALAEQLNSYGKTPFMLIKAVTKPANDAFGFERNIVDENTQKLIPSKELKINNLLKISKSHKACHFKQPKICFQFNQQSAAAI